MSARLAQAIQNMRPHLEPGASDPHFHYSTDAPLISIAISLKRIADALEKVEAMPDKMADSVFNAIANAMATR